MNGIFIFPILLGFLMECRKLSRKPNTGDGDVYAPYESEKQREKQRVAKRRHLCQSVLYFIAGVFAAGGFGYIMYLVSIFQFTK